METERLGQMAVKASARASRGRAPARPRRPGLPGPSGCDAEDRGAGSRKRAVSRAVCPLRRELIRLWGAGGRARLGRGREEFLAGHRPGAQSRGVETRLSCPGRRNCSRPFLRGRTTVASVPKSDMKRDGPTGHSPRRTRATGTSLQCGRQQHGGEAEGTGLGAQGRGLWKDVKELEELGQTLH